LKKQDATNEPKSSVKFDKKLLDFDYGEEEDDDVVVTNSPNTTSANTQHNAVSTNSSLESLGLLLTNPEVFAEYLLNIRYEYQGFKIVHDMLFEGSETTANFTTNYAKQRVLFTTRNGRKNAQVAANEAAGRRI